MPTLPIEAAIRTGFPVAKAQIHDSEPDAIWAGDLLHRRTDAEYIIRFLVARANERIEAEKAGSFVLNLDANWGKGKTFFLTRLCNHLKHEGYQAVYVNAWETDYSDDPLIPIIAKLDAHFSEQYKARSRFQQIWSATKADGMKIATAGVAGGLKGAAKRYLGSALDGISEAADEIVGTAAEEGAAAAAETLVDSVAAQTLERFKKTKASIDRFKDGLDKIVKNSSKQPFFILIDELDRCRPSYAIQLLERVKHLFSISRVVFVMATNSEQLQQAIGQVYGTGFDSRRYLLRFFDRTYRFSDPNCHDFVEQLFADLSTNSHVLSVPDNLTPVILFERLSKVYSLELRDVEQSFDILKDIVTTWTSNSKIELAALIPMIMAFQQGNPELWDATISGVYQNLKPHLRNAESAWVEYRVFEPNSSRHSVQKISLLNLSSEFIHRAKSNLLEIAAGNREQGYRGWIMDRFRDEMHSVYPTGVDQRNPPYSKIVSYPDLIRQAGKFLENTDVVK